MTSSSHRSDSSATHAPTQVRYLSPDLEANDELTVVSDVNRELAISPAYLHSIVRHMRNKEISSIIIPVIYNICHDYGKFKVFG